MGIVDGSYNQPKNYKKTQQEPTTGEILLSALERQCIEEHPDKAETIRSNCSILGMVGNYLAKK